MPRYDPDGPRRWDGQQPYAHRCTECGTVFLAVAVHAELCSNRCTQRRSRRRRKEARERERITT